MDAKKVPYMLASKSSQGVTVFYVIYVLSFRCGAYGTLCYGI